MPKKQKRRDKRLTLHQVTDANPNVHFILRTSTFIELKHERKGKDKRSYSHKKGTSEYTTVTYLKKKKIISRVTYVKIENDVQGILDKKEREFRKLKTKNAEFAGSVQAYHGMVQAKNRGRWHGSLTDDSAAYKSAHYPSINKNTDRLTSTSAQNNMLIDMMQIIERGLNYTIKRYRSENLGAKQKREKAKAIIERERERKEMWIGDDDE